MTWLAMCMKCFLSQYESIRRACVHAPCVVIYFNMGCEVVFPYDSLFPVESCSLYCASDMVTLNAPKQILFAFFKNTK